MFFLDELIKAAKPRYDDDFVDRMNYYWTALILIVFSLTLSAKQYVGEPIQCWVPAQFTGPWEQYTEKYCFVQNTYFQPLHSEIPKSYKERDEKEIGYYQWVPFILALEAFMFYLPCLVWRLLNWQSGINVKSIISMAIDTGNIESATRDKHVNTVAAHVGDALDLQRDMKGRGRLFGFLLYGKRYGSYITVLYVFVKFLYVLNVIGQFFILNSFLGFPSGSSFWGFEVLRNVARGHEWQESGHFPRVTLCDFEVRVLGNLHRYTVQCVLMINMFNEKIFVFLWFWFALVAVLTCLNFCYWLISSLLPSSNCDFVAKYLRITDAINDSPSDKRLVQRFVDLHLRHDGVFLLKIISANAGDILSTDLIHKLFDTYKKQNQAPPPPVLTQASAPEKYDQGLTESIYDPSSQTPLVPTTLPKPRTASS